MTFFRVAPGLLWLLQLATVAAEPAPYVGEWSNGRGETLTITETTIQFADNTPVDYRDLTGATDETIFELQITTRGAINAFSGKTLGVVVEEDSMTITGYASHADYRQEKNPQSVVVWFRD